MQKQNTVARIQFGPKQCLIHLWVFLMAFLLVVSPVWAETEPMTFRIKRFVVEGNTLIPEEEFRETLRKRRGFKRTIEDVEKARAEIEGLYRKAGYPAVVVNIPEQTAEGGVIKLQVVESTVGSVKVKGNRYFSRQCVLEDLPSFNPGRILYLPDLQRELEKANKNPDFKVTPVLMPGREQGTIDVELQVEDRLPLHSRLELNNRSSHNTTDLRVNGSISYDNLWQRKHSLSLQYQLSPENTDEVKVMAASYVLPAPWKRDHMMAFFGINSDSDTAFGQGFQVVGKGRIAGIRYIIPLPAYKRYAHNLTVGLDYKDFDEATGFLGADDETLKTPITYFPLSFSYSSSVPDEWGYTQFSAGVNMAFRGLVTDQNEFETKRFKARGNYIYFTAGIERTRKLPFGFNLFLKADGQIADQPLISNEQYAAGGMESVRGYKENEQLGDDAIHWTVELASPDLADVLGFWKTLDIIPYCFYDGAELRTKDPLPNEDEHATLQSAGLGVRGYMGKHLEYKVDWGLTFEDSSRIKNNEERVHFMVTYAF